MHNDQTSEWVHRARQAQAAAAQSLTRLLSIAERHDTGQARRVALFIAAVYNGEAFPFDLFELRAVDVDISDDMLTCIDALRWGKADLHNLVPDGEERILRVIHDWALGKRP